MLTYSVLGIYIPCVPRAATTSDVFNAVAEARRRDILAFLVDERPVNDIVDALELSQPSVSKHLKVLRDVGLGQTVLAVPRDSDIPKELTTLPRCRVERGRILSLSR